MTSLSSVHEAGHPKLMLLDNPGEYGWERGGGGSEWGVHMHTCGLLCKSNQKDNNASNVKFFISVLYTQ